MIGSGGGKASAKNTKYFSAYNGDDQIRTDCIYIATSSNDTLQQLHNISNFLNDKPLMQRALASALQ